MRLKNNGVKKLLISKLQKHKINYELKNNYFLN